MTAMTRTANLLLALAVTGCANIHVTKTVIIDYRANPAGTIKQKFSTANPSLGSYVGIKLEYRF